MRDIIFRGKRTDTGTWIEGYYIYIHKTTYCCKVSEKLDEENEIHQIVFERMTDWGLPNQHLRADVDPETVGQYTGITDKNGRKIYEGDILEGLNGAARMVVFFAEITGYGYGFQWRPVKGGGLFESMTGFADEYAVIGNIHDNPELLDP